MKSWETMRKRKNIMSWLPGWELSTSLIRRKGGRGGGETLMGAL
jgi:hypothetical protein